MCTLRQWFRKAGNSAQACRLAGHVSEVRLRWIRFSSNLPTFADHHQARSVVDAFVDVFVDALVEKRR